MNIALIGYGYWGPNILKSFEETKYPIKYVIDKSKENLQRALECKPSLITCDDIDFALNTYEIDAVCIALPTGLHYEIARKALTLGKHVFIEKPLTADFKKALELTLLAKAKGLKLVVDHNYAYKGAIWRLKELVEKGELGKLQYYKSERLNLGIFRPQDDVIWDLAPHDIAIVKCLMGKNPVSVSAIGFCHVLENKFDSAQLNLFYENGFVASIDVSWVHPIKERLICLGGNNAIAYFDEGRAQEEIRLYPVHFEITNGAVICSEKEPISLEIENDNAIANAGKDFINSIINDTDPLSNGDFGCDVVRIIEALEMSAKNNGLKIFL